MITDIFSFTIVVHDPNEALAFYTEKLGFEKRADNPMGPDKRWITVAPKDAQVEFVLQPLSWFEGDDRAELASRIGKSPTIVLRVDNCIETYEQLKQQDIEFTEVPTDTFYGKQAICKDLYGNTLVLLER